MMPSPTMPVSPPASRIAHQRGDIVQRLQRRDARQVGLTGVQAARLDPGGVGEGVVKIAELLFFGVERRRIARLEVRDQVLHALLAQDAQFLERTDRGAVRRNLGALEPRAVGIVEEVVARLYAGVHAAEVEAPGADRGLGRGRGQAAPGTAAAPAKAIANFFMTSSPYPSP